MIKKESYSNVISLEARRKKIANWKDECMTCNSELSATVISETANEINARVVCPKCHWIEDLKISGATWKIQLI